MLNKILIFIALLTVGIFVYMMLFKKGNKNQSFLIFLVIAYPFLRINIIPSILEVSLFDLIIWSFYFFFYKRRAESYLETPLFKIISILFAIIILVSVLTINDFTKESFEAMIQFISVTLYVIVLFGELSFENDFIYKFINSLKIPIIFSFLFLTCQLIIGVEFSLSKQLNSNILSEIVVRYPSFFQDPQKYSQFLAASSFLMLVDTKNKNKIMIQNVIFSILSVICIFFAGGRAGFSGWVLGLVVVLIFGRSIYRKILVAGIFIIGTVALAFSDKFSIFQRENLNDSYSFRISIWQDAYQIFLDNPVLGIGIGNYSNYVSVHKPHQFWIANNEIIMYDHPESGYLKFLTEFGLIGFILVLTLIIYPPMKGFGVIILKKNMTLMLLNCAIISWMIGFYSVYSLGDIRITMLIASILCMIVSQTKYAAHTE